MPYGKIDDLAAICKMVRRRYGSRAFCFRRHRPGDEGDFLDPGWIYICGGEVETADEILSRDDPKEEVLRSNVRLNGIEAVLRTADGHAF